MKDFTLYLHDLDLDFDSKSSRYNTDKFHIEWRTAHEEYHSHARKYAPNQKLRDFVCLDWRQDLSDIRCIRKCNIEPIVFSSLSSNLEIVVDNCEYDKKLIFKYKNVIDFNWTTWAKLDDDGYLSLELEELRFDPDMKYIEHEIRFWYGYLIIKAETIDINTDEYLNQG